MAFKQYIPYMIKCDQKRCMQPNAHSMTCQTVPLNPYTSYPLLLARVVMSFLCDSIAATVRQCVSKAEEEAAAAAVGMEETTAAGEVPTIGSVIADTMMGLGFESATAALDTEMMQNNPEPMEHGKRGKRMGKKRGPILTMESINHRNHSLLVHRHLALS